MTSRPASAWPAISAPASGASLRICSTDAIEIIDVPVAEPGPGEVRVRIAAAPVNPVDLAVAAGIFHAMGVIHQPERTGLGWDFAGTTVATGPGVDLAVGTRVAGMVGGFDRAFGTYAEQLVVPAADLAVVPDGLDLIAASTVPLNGLAAAQIVDLLGDAPTDGNRLLFLVIDGRSASSRGYTMVELATMMTALGAENALNLDGGGSSTIYSRKVTGEMGIINEPSDGGERKVANGIGIFYDGVFPPITPPVVPAPTTPVPTTTP